MKANKSYIVYLHTSPSGKRYVGITSQSTNNRWRNGKGYKRNEYFTKAINKHGFFLHKVAAKISEYSSALRNKLYLPFDMFAKGILLLVTIVGGYIFKGSNSIYFWLVFSLFALLFLLSLVSIVSSSRSPIEVKRRLAEVIQRKKLVDCVYR